MLDTTTVEQVYNPKRYQIMNIRSSLLKFLCGVHNHQTESEKSGQSIII